jgi:preprotein translocase subunit SecG
MYTVITIFYVSILAMVTMVWLKRRESKLGSPSVISRLGKGTDQTFHVTYESLRTGASYMNRKTFIAIAHWIAYHVLVRVRRIYVEAKHNALSNPHGKRLIDAVRGRGEVHHHGASFFLRRISADDRK